MQSAEINYDIEDKKLLAIIYFLKKWRAQLQETTKKFTIYYDHKNSRLFTIIKKLTRRQARWSKMWREYNFQIIHISKEKNDRADALNRRSDYDISKKIYKALLRKNKNSLELTSYSTITIEISDVQKIKKAYSKEDLKLLEDSEKNDYFVSNELLTINNRVYILEKLRNEIIREHHDELTDEYQKINKTWEKLSRKFYFSRMRIKITTYIDKCLKCNQNKKSRQLKQDFLQFISLSERV